MTTVSYSCEFPYRDYRGNPTPLLLLRISNPSKPDKAIETDAHIDSGAASSLFAGAFAQPLGMDLFAGRAQTYVGTSGNRIDARLHGVRISHPDLGEFDLVVGFSTGPIGRNLLGRDFLNLIQIGFRERHSLFFITPEP